MSQLAKSVIHNQVTRLARTRFHPTGQNVEQQARALSKAYASLAVMQLLDIDEEAAVEAVVDGKNDMAIDAIVVEDPVNEYFAVHLFQVKYSQDLEKDKGFGENDVIKIINSLRSLLRKDNFDVRERLDVQLTAIKASIEEFNIPNFNVYLCNNGQGFSVNAQAHIDQFLAESPENSKRYRFRYVNNVDIFRASERAEPVNCALEFAGGFVDEAINYKRAFVGKVPVTQIMELMNQYGERLLTRNVRDFLGFKKSVNDGIRATLFWGCTRRSPAASRSARLTVSRLIDKLTSEAFDNLYTNVLRDLKHLVESRLEQPDQRTDAVAMTYQFRSQSFSRAVVKHFSLNTEHP